MRAMVAATWSATARISETSSTLKVSRVFVPKESVPATFPPAPKSGWQQ